MSRRNEHFTVDGLSKRRLIHSLLYKLILFPAFERLTQTARMDTKDLTDVVERKEPLGVLGINPFLSLLKKPALMGFSRQKVHLETMNCILQHRQK